jgi:hypothetical protein
MYASHSKQRPGTDDHASNHQRQMVIAVLATSLVAILAFFGSQTARADNWTMSITVDNQYDVYFGDQFLTSPTYVGGAAHWPITDTWNINGVSPTDDLYVATASDQRVAQGLLGEFSNTTTGHTFVTSAVTGTPWQVFAAGAYLPQLNAIDPSIPSSVWPASLQPTQTQVQDAVAYATTNNLWVTPDSAPNYFNSNNPLPWGTRPGLPGNAEWIWHQAGVGSGAYPAPFNGGNQDEFLVFRIAGASVPEPSTWALLICGSGITALGLLRRRRSLGRHGLARATSPVRVMSTTTVAMVLLVAAALCGVGATGTLASSIIYQQLPDSSTAALAVNDTVPRILADDFPLTQTTQVTDLHVFGAFLSDNLPAAGASDVTFSLSLHTDNGLTPGLPVNPPLWQSTTLPSATSGPASITEAFDDPVAGNMGSDTMVFEYDFNISPVTLGPGTYWLNVEAQPGVTNNGVTAIFGWATTAPASNLGSDAAWGGSTPLGGYPTPWNPSSKSNVPFNLAFEITGNPVPEPSTVGLAGLGLVALLAIAYRRRGLRTGFNPRCIGAVLMRVAFPIHFFFETTQGFKLMGRRNAVIRICAIALVLATSGNIQATNLVMNGEFSSFTQGGPNEYVANNPFAGDAILTDWANNRPFVAVYGPNASELIGASGPSYSGPEYLWGPLNGSNNGFTDTSPNQATNPSANFLAADGDPGFFGTGISQTISTPLVMGQQYTLSYYWAASQFTDESTGPTQSGWTVMLGTQQLVDGTVVNATIPAEGFSGWNFESVNFIYSGGSSDLLSFLVIGGPAGLPPVALLDSVSLEAVPEPLSLVLMGIGLLAIIALKLRRRNRPVAA